MDHDAPDSNQARPASRSAWEYMSIGVLGACNIRHFFDSLRALGRFRATQITAGSRSFPGLTGYLRG